jgi:hypothetical protein
MGFSLSWFLGHGANVLTNDYEKTAAGRDRSHLYRFANHVPRFAFQPLAVSGDPEKSQKTLPLADSCAKGVSAKDADTT